MCDRSNDCSVQQDDSWTLLFPRLFGIASYNLDSFGRDSVCFQLCVHWVHNKGPNIVAKAIRIQMTLHAVKVAFWHKNQYWTIYSQVTCSKRELELTLKTALLFTLLVRASVILLSKVTSTFIASWGLMWPLWISSSKESVNAIPMLSSFSESHIEWRC